jgi:dolichol-phosphate mannosyltransferase
MLKKWEEGYEVIYGKRKSREGESAFKLLTASAFYSFLNKMSDTEIPKDTGDFRLVDKSVIEVINSLPEHNKFLRGLFSWVGFNQYAFEYERKERVAGKTKYPLKKMLKLAGDGIIGFSKKPLKLIYKMAFFSLFLFVAVIIATIVIHVNNWQNIIFPGWTTIMLAITFLSALILFALGFIGEYIMRIYDETRQRPQYIVKETINIDKK